MEQPYYQSQPMERNLATILKRFRTAHWKIIFISFWQILANAITMAQEVGLYIVIAKIREPRLIPGESVIKSLITFYLEDR